MPFLPAHFLPPVPGSGRLPPFPGHLQAGKEYPCYTRLQAGLQIFPGTLRIAAQQGYSGSVDACHRTIRIKTSRQVHQVIEFSRTYGMCFCQTAEVRHRECFLFARSNNRHPFCHAYRRLCREASVHVGYLVLNAT